MIPIRYMVFDVESVGIHGGGFAVGWVNLSASGEVLSEGLLSADPVDAYGYADDRRWVLENVPALDYDCSSVKQVRDRFWVEWMAAKNQGAYLVADVAWPVEANFLLRCVDDLMPGRKWDGPYPLLDLSSILFALGGDPLGEHPRLPREEPKHHPLHDARQSARLLADALRRRTSLLDLEYVRDFPEKE